MRGKERFLEGCRGRDLRTLRGGFRKFDTFGLQPSSLLYHLRPKDSLILDLNILSVWFLSAWTLLDSSIRQNEALWQTWMVKEPNYVTVGPQLCQPQQGHQRQRVPHALVAPHACIDRSGLHHRPSPGAMDEVNAEAFSGVSLAAETGEQVGFSRVIDRA